MTKFHINAKGIPGPCRAQKGMCPYGGSTGSDNHYDSIEEAQEAAVKQNEEKYGLLGNNKSQNISVEISPEAFDEIFYDSVDSHGYENVGLCSEEFEDTPEAEELVDALPQDFHYKYEDEIYTLVKEGNIPALVDKHIVTEYGARGEMEKDDVYFDMLSSAEQDNSANVITDDKGNKSFSPEFNERLNEYITDELTNNAELEVNGTKVYVNTDSDFDVNWADKYIQSRKINISDEAFDEIFYDSVDSHGFENVGLCNEEFEDTPETEELINSLPASFHKKYDDEVYTLVKEDNIPALVDKHIITRGGLRVEMEKDSTYEDMLDTIQSKSPESIIINPNGDRDMSDDFRKNLNSYVTNELKGKSELEVNGQKIYVSTDKELDVNWAEKYFNK